MGATSTKMVQQTMAVSSKQQIQSERMGAAATA
jgi:hypothetical protein